MTPDNIMAVKETVANFWIKEMGTRIKVEGEHGTEEDETRRQMTRRKKIQLHIAGHKYFLEYSPQHHEWGDA